MSNPSNGIKNDSKALSAEISTPEVKVGQCYGYTTGELILRVDYIKDGYMSYTYIMDNRTYGQLEGESFGREVLYFSVDGSWTLLPLYNSPLYLAMNESEGEIDE